MNHLTYCAPGDSQEPKWLLTFEDPDKGYCLFSDEVEAMSVFAKASQTWNCCLWQLVSMPDNIDTFLIQ